MHYFLSFVGRGIFRVLVVRLDSLDDRLDSETLKPLAEHESPYSSRKRPDRDRANPVVDMLLSRVKLCLCAAVPTPGISS